MHLYGEVAIDDDKEIKSLDFLFLQFMHIIRAQHEDFDTTTQSVLNFFTKQDKKCIMELLKIGYTKMKLCLLF